MPILRGCEDQVLEVLARGAQFVRFASGASVFERGSMPTGLYFVHDGAVRLMSLCLEGRPKVVEIFEPGGKTPPNTHSAAEECFFVLAGEGVATADDRTMPIGPGDCFVLRPGVEHVVENTGAKKLYCLTLMTPNEGFAELIRNGTPVDLLAEDIAVLTGRA